MKILKRFIGTDQEKLEYLIDNNDIGLLKKLVKKGIDLNMPFGDSYFDPTPIEYALIWNNNERMTQLLLEQGADIHKVSGYDKDLLIKYVENGFKEIAGKAKDIVKLLIKHGVTINQKWSQSFSALHCLWASSDELKKLNEKNILHAVPFRIRKLNNIECEVEKILIEHGADVNARGDLLIKVLNDIIVTKQLERLKLFIGHNMRLNNEECVKLIKKALSFGCFEMAKLLSGQYFNVYDEIFLEISTDKNVDIKALKFIIEQGVNVNITDEDGISALGFALIKRNFDLIKFLLNNGAEINNKEIETLLFRDAIKFNDEELLKLLIEECNVSVDVVNNDACPALIYAIQYANFSAAKVLFELGADVNVNDKYGKTPLIFAYENELFDLAKLFVEKSCELVINNKEELISKIKEINSTVENDLFNLAIEKSNHDQGVTPIIWAIQGGHSELVKKLIERGYDINAQDKEGNTSLNWAIQGRHLNILNILLNNKVDIDSRDKSGLTILMNASIGASGQEFFEAVKILISLGVEVNAKTNTGRTALMYAAERGHSKVVKLLIEQGADVNSQTTTNRVTALLLASHNCQCHKHSKEVIHMLIKKGADVNIKDRDGRTPLIMCVFEDDSWGQDISEVIRELINLGADINAKDKYGKTVLEYAQKGKYSNEIIRLL